MIRLEIRWTSSIPQPICPQFPLSSQGLVPNWLMPCLPLSHDDRDWDQNDQVADHMVCGGGGKRCALARLSLCCWAMLWSGFQCWMKINELSWNVRIFMFHWVPAIIHFLPKCPNSQIFGMAKSVPNCFQMPKPVFFLSKFRKKVDMSGQAVIFPNLVSTPIFIPNTQIHCFPPYLSHRAHQSPVRR